MPVKSELQNIDNLRGKAEGLPDDTEAVKQELAGVKAQLEELAAAVKDTPALVEVEKLKASVEAITVTVGDIPGAYEQLVKSLEKRVDELQTGAALLSKTADAPEGIKAITRDIMDSDAYKSIHDDQGQRAGAVAAPGQWSHPQKVKSLAAACFKAASPVVITDMAGGQQTQYRPGILEAREWAMGVAGRIPSVIVKNARTYAVPKETLAGRYGAWTSKLAADLDGDPTPKSTIEFDAVDGLMVGSVVRFFNSTGGVLGSSIVVSMNETTKVVTFTTDSLTWDATTGWRVTSENYGVTAELGTKPSGFAGTENVEFVLKPMATIIPTTVNALNTIEGMEALIERKLPVRDMRNLSRHVMYGDDGAKQLQGWRTYAGAQSYLWSAGTVGDNRIDAIMRAANLIPWGVQLSVVMNQLDLPELYLLKATDGHYLRTGNFGMVPLTQVGLTWFLGPLELVFDYAVARDDFTVINFAGASEMADQDTASLMWGYVNNDFEINVIRARYEAMRAHAIVDPNEFVVGEHDGAPV